MKNPAYIIVIALLISLAIIGVGYFNLFQQHKALEKEQSILLEEYSEFKQETNTVITELDQELTKEKQETESLTKDLNETEEEKEKVEEKHEVLKKEVKKTLAKVNTYEKELEDSMAWFKANSQIEDKTIKYYLNPGSCYRKGTVSCRIKTGCFYFINSERLGYNYKDDEVTTNKVDKLMSLAEFMTNKGGDCEDYSLFYKAEYNHIVDECKSEGADNIIIEAWKQNDNPESKYWVEFSDNWFLSGAEEHILDPGYIYPSIICGHLYDLNKNSAGGHCMIAFTKEKIEEVNDLGLLKGSPMIEPQNGIFMGIVNGASETYLLEKENYNTAYSYIGLVITDDDLFLFSDEHKEWLSYSLFKDELEEKRIEMSEYIS